MVGECVRKVVLPGLKQKLKGDTVKGFILCPSGEKVSGLAPSTFFNNIPHNGSRILEKMTGIWNQELLLLLVNANNRAVCL